MSYEYTDPKREHDPHALPDVEVFHSDCLELTEGDKEVDGGIIYNGDGFYYAYGLPGCLWDSDPVGPFETYEEALEDVRENSGGYEDE